MIHTFISAALSAAAAAAVSFNLESRSAENRWGLKGSGVGADHGEVAGFSRPGAPSQLDRCHTSAAHACLTDSQEHGNTPTRRPITARHSAASADGGRGREGTSARGRREIYDSRSETLL